MAPPDAPDAILPFGLASSRRKTAERRRPLLRRRRPLAHHAAAPRVVDQLELLDLNAHAWIGFGRRATRRCTGGPRIAEVATPAPLASTTQVNLALNATAAAAAAAAPRASSTTSPSAAHLAPAVAAEMHPVMRALRATSARPADRLRRARRAAVAARQRRARRGGERRPARGRRRAHEQEGRCGEREQQGGRVAHGARGGRRRGGARWPGPRQVPRGCGADEAPTVGQGVGRAERRRRQPRVVPTRATASCGAASADGQQRQFTSRPRSRPPSRATRRRLDRV